MNDDIRRSASVRRFQIDGGLLLLDDSSKCLFAYNDTARHIWELIEAGLVEDDLTSEFAAAWGIPLSRARSDIQSIVTQWRAQGLLARGEVRRALAAQTPDVVADRPPAPPPRWASEWTCTIRGTTIAFAVENEPLAAVRLMLEHLETPAARPQSRLELRTGTSGEAVLVRDGVERLRTRDQGLLIGGIWHAILELIHPNVEWLALIHGAALARDGKGIALCGPSGSGKTTLAAGLMSAGFDYLADDLVALAAPDGTIVPWPMPLSIKPGSVNVVAPHYRDLARAPSYPTKGVEARLIAPPSTAWDAEPVRLRSLVFPRFVAGAAPEMQRISTFQAIERLLIDRLWIGHPITADRVTAFLAWLGDTPAYVSSYGTLDDGMRLIEDLAA